MCYIELLMQFRQPILGGTAPYRRLSFLPSFFLSSSIRRPLHHFHIAHVAAHPRPNQPTNHPPTRRRSDKSDQGHKTWTWEIPKVRCVREQCCQCSHERMIEIERSSNILGIYFGLCVDHLTKYLEHRMTGNGDSKLRARSWGSHSPSYHTSLREVKNRPPRQK